MTLSKTTLIGLLALFTIFNKGSAQFSITETTQPIGAFDLVAANTGWILSNNQLFWTDSNGETWYNISPEMTDEDFIGAVKFIDRQRGWALVINHTIDSAPQYKLAHTTNNGRSWQWQPLNLFSEGNPAAFAQAAYLHFLDEQTGWLLIKQATSSNFNQGTLFKTEDGGQTWTQLNAPGGGPIYFPTPEIGWLIAGTATPTPYTTTDGGLTWQIASLDDTATAPHQIYPPFSDGNGHGMLATATFNEDQTTLSFYTSDNQGQSWQTAVSTATNAPLTNLKMIDAQTGWALQSNGNCETPETCTQTRTLLQTQDGGATWSAIPLPKWAENTPSTSVSSVLTPNADHTATFIGHGFDKCEIPTLSQLQTWKTGSPYDAVNLYIGGIHRGCSNAALTAAYVQQMSDQGWVFIPTWVGPQAACSNYTHRISYDLDTAYNEGVAEANAALAVAVNLGLAAPDQSGTIIYYDLEGYNATDDQPCRDASNAFMTGWTDRLNNQSSQSGVYGSACASYLSDFASITNVPDALWPAAWYWPGGSGGYDPTASVFDVPCISNALWANHQRIRQYAGDIWETWDGVSLLIDSDVFDGVVVDLQNGGNCCGCALANQNNHTAVSPFSHLLSPIGPYPPEPEVSIVEFESEWELEAPYTVEENLSVYEIETAVSPIPTVQPPDTTPPTLNLVIGSGKAVVNHLPITLHLNANDDRAVTQMRFSADGETWSEWEPFNTQHSWLLKESAEPQIVYAQVKDAAGNVSEIMETSATAVLNIEWPSSTSYQLRCSVFGMGGGTKSSSSYTVYSTTGQPHTTGNLQSGSYQVHSGFWSGCGAPTAPPMEPDNWIYLPTIIK